MDYQYDQRKLITRRLEVWKDCSEDMIFRKEILHRCEEDPVFWCNNFAFTYDPREQFTPNRHLPFILWPRQVECIEWINDLLKNHEDGVIKKSRDLGASYITLIPIILHKWLFHDFNAKIGSRKEDNVYKPGDPDSLFWKVEYNLKRLPKWMLPDGFDLAKHFTYMKLVRPDNTNTITGESANESFARSGRNNIALFDEHAFWPFARASWEAAGESVPTRLSISTPPPAGQSSFFYKLQKSEKVKVFTFHVSSDPRKDNEWHEKKKAKSSTDEYEREVNISFKGSTENTVYAADFQLCELGKFDYNPNLPLFTSWDFGLNGIAIGWFQWDHKTDHWYLVESYFNSQKGIGFYPPLVTGEVKSGDYQYTRTDLDVIQRHKYWKATTHYGDPDVKKRGLQTEGIPISTQEILNKSGIYVQSKPWAGRTHFDLKQKALIFLRKLSIDEEHNELFIDAMLSARYPDRSETSQSTSPISAPIDDWTSHHRTMFEYMADNAPTKHRDNEKELKKKTVKRVILNPLVGY